MSSNEYSRRAFLAATTSVLAAGCATPGATGNAPLINTAAVVPGRLSPNEKLNIAAIGVGGMGRNNIAACAEENIVALCDVDWGFAGRIGDLYPNARRYSDFREMFDKEDKNIDAVIIATPDHTHAVIAMEAIRRKKHIYLQKPLAHNLHEVRVLTEAARVAGIQTQMGNQGHSSDQIRRVYEWIEDGAIGPVRQVYAWSDRPVGGDPWSDFPLMARPAETPPVPETLHWDLWLGPAPARPYHPVYHPLTWRGFYDFGTGALGDMGCHILDPAFFALKLGHPSVVQATTTHFEPGVQEETYARASVVRYQFPERGNMPPLKLTWFDGRLKPPVPEAFGPEDELGGNGALFIGEKGVIGHGSHGASGAKLYPKSLADSYQDPPKTLPRVPQEEGAHEKDWVRACKEGTPASSNFEYGGALTEMVLLGVLALRVPNERLLWDGAAQRVTNHESANALINPPYREGWSL